MELARAGVGPALWEVQGTKVAAVSRTQMKLGHGGGSHQPQPAQTRSPG